MSARPIVATPERLLGRNDSKNSATTCKGITSTGRPCRRALAIAKLSMSTGKEADGIMAIVHEDGRLADAQYYCWQHKDQVQPLPTEKLAKKQNDKSTQVFNLKNRASIDSLMQNLNIKTERPDPTSDTAEKKHGGRKSSRRPPPSDQPNFWRSLCCMIAAKDDETIEIVRHKHRVAQGRTSTAGSARLPSSQRSALSAAYPRPKQEPATTQPLTYIKPGTSPQIAASLLSELAKPVSTHDDDGYIYMFWLTPGGMKPPQRSATDSLLDLANKHDRRLSDVMSDYSVPGDRQKIMVKIGRASNVTRRMNEWQRQCGYELSLIRWYPYVSKSVRATSRRGSEQARASPLYPDLSQHGKPTFTRGESDGLKKVRFVKRVERLIHIELSEQQIKRQCGTCGREHREWFAIEASEQRVRAVDEVIRRWVEWSERQPS